MWAKMDDRPGRDLRDEGLFLSYYKEACKPNVPARQNAAYRPTLSHCPGFHIRGDCFSTAKWLTGNFFFLTEMREIRFAQLHL